MVITTVRKHCRTTHNGKKVKVRSHKRNFKHMTYSQLRRAGIKLPPNQDADGDGVKNKRDCRPLNKKEQGLLHRNVDKIRRTQEFKKLPPSKKRQLSQALNNLKRASTKEEVKTWLKTHKKLIATTVGTGVALTFAVLVGTTVGAAVPQKTFVGVFPKKDQSKIRKAFSQASRKFEEGSFKTNKAKLLFRNKQKVITDLRRKGFTQKQAELLWENKIITAERKPPNR